MRRLVNLAYHLRTRNLDAEERERFDAELARLEALAAPADDDGPPSWWREQDDGTAALGVMAQLAALTGGRSA